MKKKQNINQQLQNLFEVGDLVGAKVKGHPTWPGTVEEVKLLPHDRREYVVRFFYTDDIAKKFIELKPFKDLSAKELSCSRKGFKEALDLCQKQLKSTCTNGRRRRDKPTIISQSHILQIDHSAKEDEKVDDVEKSNRDEEANRNKEDDEKELNLQRVIFNTLPDVEENSPDDDASVDDRLACFPSLVQPEQANCIDEIQIKNTANDLKNRKHNAKSKLSKAAGENFMQSTDRPIDRETIIAKMQEKVDAKLQEKEVRKQNKKYQRLGEKASKKFPIIKTNLTDLSKVFKKLSKVKVNANLITDKPKWNGTVRKYNSLLPILEKYIKTYFMTEYSKGYRERGDCLETLQNIVTDLQKAKKNKVLPINIRDEVKKMLRNMRQHEVLRDFINDSINNTENSKNAMTERLLICSTENQQMS